MDTSYEFQPTRILRQGTPKYYRSVCPECGCEFLFLKSEATFCMSDITCPQCKNDYILSGEWYNNPMDISGDPIVSG